MTKTFGLDYVGTTNDYKPYEKLDTKLSLLCQNIAYPGTLDIVSDTRRPEDVI